MESLKPWVFLPCRVGMYLSLYCCSLCWAGPCRLYILIRTTSVTLFENSINKRKYCAFLLFPYHLIILAAVPWHCPAVNRHHDLVNPDPVFWFTMTGNRFCSSSCCLPVVFLLSVVSAGCLLCDLLLLFLALYVSIDKHKLFRVSGFFSFIFSGLAWLPLFVSLASDLRPAACSFPLVFYAINMIYLIALFLSSFLFPLFFQAEKTF